MHDVLLQKSDGTFMPVIWNERLKGSDEVTVKFGDISPVIAVYDPIIGVEPVRTVRMTDSVKLALSDQPIVLAISQKR